MESKFINAVIPKEFENLILSGKSYSKIVKAMMNEEPYKQMPRHDVNILVMTVASRILNEKKAIEFEKFYEVYQIVDASDENCCEYCKSMSKKIFRFKDRKVGVNFPPLHPWCRCTYDIIVPDEQEWIDNYVEQNGGDPEISDEQKAHAKEIYDRLEGGAGDESE